MLSGKKIIITGAASGIGAETAKFVKKNGGTVIAFDRNEPGNYADIFIKVDLSDEVSIDKAVAQFHDKADALCNIAGIPPTLPPEMLLKVNVIGLRYFTEKMIDKLNDGASIVNLASMAGYGWRNNIDKVGKLLALASTGAVAKFCRENNITADNSYEFSKEALIVWTHLNWDTWKRRDIRINAVSPGPVETPILGDFVQMMGERAEEDLKRLRAGTAGEIAAVVGFLCSEQSSWIRGANIPVDGGLNAGVEADIIRGIKTVWSE